MIDDPELRRLFRVESDEHLSSLDNGLLRLEKTPGDPALLEEVFRAAHSLKGAARMLGLGRVEAAAHALEGILNAARKGDVPLTAETIEQMNGALGELRRHVQEVLEGEPPSTTVPPATETLATESAPSAVIGEPGPIDPEAIPVAAGEPAPLPAPAPPATPVATALPFSIETVRVETRKLDELLTQVGELSVIQGRARHRLSLMEALLEQWAALQRSRRGQGSGQATRRGALREAPARFGVLLRQARDALFDDSARLESSVTLLEEQVYHLRLLPLSTVFTLFPRMVHDLAREQGKEVDLAVEGEDISVDKRILEEMKDPLMHLLRNAIDHGIELPPERERLGKPRAGSVRLCARRENGGVLLLVQDDGRGLDPATIRREAGKRGLYDEAALASMTPEQLQQLILLPGFSTSSFVTELSGRGVGLDVVRVNVERLKGAIRLASTAGQGLTVQLRLPLSITSTRLLLVRAGDRLYGVPIEFVHTSRHVDQADIHPLEGRPTLLLDGQPVVVARLADLLELPPGEPEAPAGWACIVLQVGDERLGLLTDELMAEEVVVPKPLGAPLRRVRNISALAVLGSGEICMVLNPADLLRSSYKSVHAVHAAQGEAHETRREGGRPVVLLVEDSALIRAMEQRILADAGYQVVTAVDGTDALNSLADHSFAAVVSDIVMPNMDGLTLTAHIRAEPRYQELPVILVTTLASDEDKRRGLEVGANAYIPKPAFDQRVLLETLKRLIV